MTYEELPSLPIDTKGADENPSKKSKSEDVGRIIWGLAAREEKMKKKVQTFGDELFARLTKNRKIRRSEVGSSQYFSRDLITSTLSQIRRRKSLGVGCGIWIGLMVWTATWA